MYVKRRGKVWVWALMAGCLVALLGLWPSVSAAQQQFPYEGGDAPSSHNHGGGVIPPWPAPTVMQTYPGSGVQANFPVVWDFDNTLGPGPGGGAYPAGYYGFCHAMGWVVSFLGTAPSGELDADMLPDQDTVTNIDPPTNTANRDGSDDGVTVPTLLPQCGTATVTITGQNNTRQDLNVNAWFDWNRDGDWEDGSVCGCGDNEWAIQDQTVVPGAFTLNIPIVPCHPTVPYDPLWARVTLAPPQLSALGPPYIYGGSPNASWGGEGCFDDGETEDYFVQPQQPAFDLGDLVWYDTDQDGLQDAGEPGVQGILATLYPNGACTGRSLATDTTDANGNYLFNVSYGTYCVEFSSIPAGWHITSQDQGADDTIDSDADPATGQIQNIVLLADDYDEDMGLYADGSIGDTVWCDSNGNGEYDAGEGIDDVTVWLYSDPDCDGDESDGVLLETTETAGGGQYAFTDLNTGPPLSTDEVCYVVLVDTTDPGLGACNAPLTAVRFGILLDALDPDTGAADFGFTGQAVAAFVPEWSTLALLGSGLAGLAGYARLRWRKK